jgi:hypothetical protein
VIEDDEKKDRLLLYNIVSVAAWGSDEARGKLLEVLS